MLAPQRTPAGLLSGQRANKREAAVLEFSKQLQTVIWDFSVDGGAVGSFSFGAALPAGSVVTNIYVDEQTAVLSATDLKLQAGSTDISASVDFTAAAGVRSAALAGAATAIKLAAASELKMVITTTAATAGKVRWAVEFYVSK